MKKNLFLLLIVISISNLLAQKEKNIWYFGRHAGIDFNSGSPVAITNSNMYANEASAVMNDSNGRLLFYTNGVTVWNSIHDTMENSNGLLGCTSSSQTLIVPKPGIQDSLYYIFTTDCWENEFQNGLRYSVVDLKYNNGLGKVTKKNVFLHFPVVEKITAITHANGYDFWVIAHEYNSDKFLVYLLNCAGLDTIPVISSVGHIQGDTSIHNGVVDIPGYLKSSYNGSKLAMCSYIKIDNIVNPIIELYDFNSLSGTISNPIFWYDTSSVFKAPCLYGVSFSPNNSKLYITFAAAPWSYLEQYDLTAGSVEEIEASRVKLYYDSNQADLLLFGGIESGPDGKIYVSHYTMAFGFGDTTIGVINAPNNQGIACNYAHNGFSLKGKASLASMCNFIETPFNYVECYVSVNDNESIKNEIEIFPNPNNGKFFISNMLGKHIADIEIYNSLGNLIKIVPINSIDNNNGINLSETAGFYYLKFNLFDKKNLIKKIIITN